MLSYNFFLFISECYCGSWLSASFINLHYSKAKKRRHKKGNGKKTINHYHSSLFLCCRYNESTNELINDDLGIAYPIIDGIPNMIPQAARMIHKDQKPEESDQKSE